MEYQKPSARVRELNRQNYPGRHPEFIDANGNKMPPEQALTLGICPETGVDLEGRDIDAHIRTLYPKPLPNEAKYDGARAQIERLRAYAQQRASRTPAAKPQVPSDATPASDPSI